MTRTYTRWTPEMMDEVRRRRLAGETCAEIAAEYGLHPNRILQIAPLDDAQFEARRAEAAERCEQVGVLSHDAAVRARVRKVYLEMRPELIAWARGI